MSEKRIKNTYILLKLKKFYESNQQLKIIDINQLLSP